MKIKPPLYHPAILDHSKSPRYFVVLKDATHKAQGYNPSCGDHLTVYCYVADNRISKITFHGEMCAICKSAASMMTHFALDLPVSKIADAAKAFDRLLDGKEDKRFADLNCFHIVSYYPARKKCASLPWYTLCAALENKKEVSTE